MKFMQNPPPPPKFVDIPPCRSCGYKHGVVYFLGRSKKGFIRCGQCDSPLYFVDEIPNRSVGKRK